MATTGIVRKSKKQQRIDAELGLIIDDMSRAMWAADKQYIAERRWGQDPLTLHMQNALMQFKDFCVRHYGK